LTESDGRALSGVRVLDFTRVLAGPFCTMMLADLGADVIKVEDPARGDETRQWGPPWAGEGDVAQSAYFLSVNRNKRSLTLNLKSSEGQAIARRLAAQSHIVTENFKPGQMGRFGLGYADLSALNPALVYGSITGYGQTGPYSDRPGYDFVIQAMSGLMSITGPVEGSPSKIGVALSDVIAGLFASSSILAALRHSERTGQGQHLDIALMDTQIAALVNVASNYLVSGQTPGRYGNQHPNIVPYQSFRASDGEFALAVGNDRQFAQLCALIEQPELADDPRFATNPARVHNRETLIPLLQAVFASRAAAEWVDGLLALGIPSGPINDVAAALEDSHVQARGLIQETTLANGEALRMVGPPVPFSATPAEVRLPPPALGQHTDDILREVLNINDATIAAYRTEGIL
jgi:crotonobetainyl-CoA:carnitine CoA-transferase CaiB-like acyl-CoA transferase